MPGIVALIAKKPQKKHTLMLGEMVERMMHESFYTSGTYQNESIGVYAGWVNRADSFSDCMPVWNEAHDICLVFSGEHFFEKRDVDALRSNGHTIDAANAGFLVHLYEEQGLKFLAGLNGWFNGLLIDLRKKSILLFNDRFGMGRLYYHEKDGNVFIASEAKALLKVLPELRRLDMTGLGEQFSCGCTLKNRTLFDGVSLLPAGSCWTFSGNGIRKELYFDKTTWEQQPPLTNEEYYRQLKETFARILPRYFNGKEQVAVSLTGGVDSRMVMAWANQAPGNLPCFTFGGPYRDCTDVKIARQVAEICRQPHYVFPVAKKFLSEFPALAQKTVYVTDGCQDVSGTPDLFTSRMARNIAPVRLTGNYGGEILRSLVVFRPSPPGDNMLAQEFETFVRNARETYVQEFTGSTCSFVAFKQVPWHHYSRMTLERSQITIRSPYLDNDLVAHAFRVPAEIATSNLPALRLIADGNPELGTIGTDRGVLVNAIPLITKINNLYQEFTFKAEYAYDYGMPQWVAMIDHALAPLRLERLFLGKHKFYHFRVWYRDDLAPYIKEVLLDPRSLKRPYLNGQTVETMVKDHTSGRRNHTLALHRLLTTELIQRTLIET